MKKTKYFAWLIAAGMAMSGCSDEMDGPGTETGKATIGNGYVKLTINLPTEGIGTRTVQDGTNANDKFDDGEESEYTVNDGLIAFFKSDIDKTETDAIFLYATNMEGLKFTTDGNKNDNITSKQTLTISGVPTIDVDEQMYALIILNKNSVASVSEGKLMIGPTAISKLSDLTNSENGLSNKSDAKAFTSSGFFMVNAPISDRPSETASFTPNVTTLAKVTVYDEDPSNDTSIQGDPIYVERAVAKVEVDVTGTTTISATKDAEKGEVSLPVSIDGTAYSNHKVVFEQWALTVTNKSSKIVRDVTGYTNWATYFNANAGTGIPNRFFGTTPRPYRVYWAIDANYDNNTSSNDFQSNNFNLISETSDTKCWHNMITSDSKTNIDYCFENTMTSQQQIEGFTTGVLLTGRYQIGDATNADVFSLSISEAIYGVTEMEEFINGVLGITEDNQKYHFQADAYEEGVIIGDGKTGTGDTEEAKKIAEYQKAFKTQDGTVITEDNARKLIANVNIGTITYYKGGRTYYWTRPIKHFGDYYTPLYDKDNNPVDYYESAKNYTDKNHLGRYGVVRNNWYQINITSVSGPGYPTIPEIPTEPENPDDSGTGYVKIEANVLSWAVHKQEVTLR